MSKKLSEKILDNEILSNALAGAAAGGAVGGVSGYVKSKKEREEIKELKNSLRYPGHAMTLDEAAVKINKINELRKQRLKNALKGGAIGAGGGSAIGALQGIRIKYKHDAEKRKKATDTYHQKMKNLYSD